MSHADIASIAPDGLPYLDPRVSDFLQKDNGRVSREWAMWDGTAAHGEQINDIQCARIAAMRKKLTEKEA